MKIKHLLSTALVLLGALTSVAQTPMPVNPKVKHGTLPNGMQYYILHNEEPKERANFYIAQKVGSTLETPEQLGLAHFLEHMAFNGTTNFPGKTMINYLQSKGITFGNDINAYTGFDETVYRINNVPSTDIALMDSCLLVLHDWSCDLTLATEEINAERGVIQEEWRSRNDAQTRQFTAILPQIFEEYQYRQMPIGTMDVVMNFDPQVLRDYYHKWYRPDQQGIVVVGDFDADEMEKKVIAMFSPIPMPENAAPRTYPTVSDNKEPIYCEFQDPETQYTMATLAFKSDKTPFELRNTYEAYMMDNIVPTIIARLLDNRLEEYTKEADCQYAYAGTYFGNFSVSSTKDAFNLVTIAKSDIKSAFEQTMGIVARACKTGFTDSELQRVKDDLLAGFEKAYNERNTTKSDPLAQELIRNFIDNTPAPGIEFEKQLADQVFPTIDVQTINSICTGLLTPENEVMIVSAPTSAGQLPGRDVMLGVLSNAMNAQYEAYVDEVITDPLINKYLKPGKISKEEKNAELGTTTYTLSNGVKVIVKPTDFAADEILMNAFRVGGKETYTAAQAANVNMMDDAYSASRLGAFDTKTLTKYLAGKHVSLGYNMNARSNDLAGSSTVKDLETLLDLTYASFTALGADQATYDTELSRTISMLQAQANNPMLKFQQAQMKTAYGDNPFMTIPSVESVQAANYTQTLDLVKASLANAADYTFIFTGNVDPEVLKPMLCKYIASLPSKKKAKPAKVVTPIELVAGNVTDKFDQPMQTPTTFILEIYNGTTPFSIKSQVMVGLLGDVLANVYTETLREEEGGSYSPYAYATMNPLTGRWQLNGVVTTNAEQRDQMLKRGYEEAMKLMQQGANAEQFGKVKEAAVKQYENSVRSNSWWLGNLIYNARGVNTISNRGEIIKSITLDDFNAFIKTLWNGKDRIQIVMTGVEEAK